MVSPELIKRLVHYPRGGNSNCPRKGNLIVANQSSKFLWCQVEGGSAIPAAISPPARRCNRTAVAAAARQFPVDRPDPTAVPPRRIRVVGSIRPRHNIFSACDLKNAKTLWAGKAAMAQGRRTLRFNSLDEVMPDVERLLEGHSTVGNWSLAQICRHVSTVMRRVVDLPASTPVNPSQWAPEERKREVLESGMIPEGLPAPPEILPAEGLNEREEAEGLRAAIAHYKSLERPRDPTPNLRTADEGGVGPHPVHSLRPPSQLRRPGGDPSLKETHHGRSTQTQDRHHRRGQHRRHPHPPPHKAGARCRRGQLARARVARRPGRRDWCDRRHGHRSGARAGTLSS